MGRHHLNCFSHSGMNGTLSALTIRLADSKRILTHGSAFADWFLQGRNAEALYALLAHIFYLYLSSPLQKFILYKSWSTHLRAGVSRATRSARPNMVIWFYSSSRFGNCSNYSFLLSENNSMATHKSGLQVFSSGQAST